MTQTSLTHLISAACADARSTPSTLDTTEATLRARARARHLHLDAFQPIAIELLIIRTSCTCGRTYEAPNGGNPLLVYQNTKTLDIWKVQRAPSSLGSFATTLPHTLSYLSVQALRCPACTPSTICEDYFGLEPNYIFELLPPGALSHD